MPFFYGILYAYYTNRTVQYNLHRRDGEPGSLIYNLPDLADSCPPSLVLRRRPCGPGTLPPLTIGLSNGLQFPVQLLPDLMLLVLFINRM